MIGNSSSNGSTINSINLESRIIKNAGFQAADFNGLGQDDGILFAAGWVWSISGIEYTNKTSFLLPRAVVFLYPNHPGQVSEFSYWGNTNNEIVYEIDNNQGAGGGLASIVQIPNPDFVLLTTSTIVNLNGLAKTDDLNTKKDTFAITYQRYSDLGVNWSIQNSSDSFYTSANSLTQDLVSCFGSNFAKASTILVALFPVRLVGFATQYASNANMTLGVVKANVFNRQNYNVIKLLEMAVGDNTVYMIPENQQIVINAGEVVKVAQKGTVDYIYSDNLYTFYFERIENLTPVTPITTTKIFDITFDNTFQ